jgi:hypothetical protein
MKISPYIIYLELQPNALLLRQNFDSQKVSVTLVLSQISCIASDLALLKDEQKFKLAGCVGAHKT